MAALLINRDKKQLSEWIGKDCHFKLLYKISRDGCTPQKFHELCDNKGPTVTIFYNTDNNVYGGYASESWKSEGEWYTDKNSFLFKLYTISKWQPKIFPLKGGKTSNLYFDSGNGPQFEDLMSFENKVDSTLGNFSLNSDNMFESRYYDSKNEDAQSIANGHNNVTDMEVYLIKDGLPVSWRQSPAWEEQTLHTLKDSIRSFSPLKDSNVSEVNILLVGHVGAGKSSLLNTINSIFRGEISSRAWTGSSQHSLTTSFNKFRVRDQSSGNFLKFRLCDTRGLEESLGIKNDDIVYILDGNLPNNYKFNPVAAASSDINGFQKHPTLKDKIHLVVFVLDGSTFDVIPEGISKKLMDIREMIIDRGIPLLVFATKIDKVCSLVDENVQEVFHSQAVKEMVENIADSIAIPKAHVLPVKNYEREGCLETDVSILALNALKQALVFTNDFLENQCELLEKGATQLNVKD
ncbi:interferon-induced protein 44-like [Saccostrea cucullata]|uniref:interferon-induced protein 44-like n=1 Tax=Saccostrea cuccullata TaxID=36930 RepID=UPI002ED6021C